MHVRILYFALLRDRLGRAEESLELPEGSTAHDLLAALAERSPVIAGARRSLQVAVNHEMVPLSHPLKGGDEIALIPPVSGGAGESDGGQSGVARQRTCRISREPLVWQEVIDAVSGPGQGGITVFCGVVRDHNDGKQVVRLDYEAYDEMAQRTMTQIAARIEAEIAGARIAMVHRVGSLRIGDTAVLVAASAPHRAEAFAACRAAIEALKREVPVWKKEFSPEGAEWLGDPQSA